MKNLSDRKPVKLFQQWKCQIRLFYSIIRMSPQASRQRNIYQNRHK